MNIIERRDIQELGKRGKIQCCKMLEFYLWKFLKSFFVLDKIVKSIMLVFIMFILNLYFRDYKYFL